MHKRTYEEAYQVDVVEAEEEQKHPLLNKDSSHYSMVDGIEAIERLEQMYTKEELAIWSKITAMKYRLRITNKDAVEREAQKIRTYEAYYKYLKAEKDNVSK